MRRKLIISIIFVFSLFMFCHTAKAATPVKTCYYNSSGKAAGYYQFAELTIYDPAKSSAKVEFTELMAPDLNCNMLVDAANVAIPVAAAGAGALGGAKIGGVACSFAGPLGTLICGGIGGAVGAVAGIIADKVFVNQEKRCGFNTNNVNSSKPVDYTKAASGKYINTNLSYVDGNKEMQKVALPALNLSSTDCPEYVGVVINDKSYDKKNIQVFAGDSNIRNFVDNYVKNNESYNYSIWGTEFQRTGQNGTGGQNGGSASQEDRDLTTCTGVLGNKINNEYVQGSVGALLQQIFNYMKMAAVILVFTFSVIDYAKAIAAQNADAFKKANVNLIKRVIFGIVFFLIPAVVNLILSVIDSSTCGIQ